MKGLLLGIIAHKNPLYRTYTEIYHKVNQMQVNIPYIDGMGMVFAMVFHCPSTPENTTNPDVTQEKHRQSVRVELTRLGQLESLAAIL